MIALLDGAEYEAIPDQLYIDSFVALAGSQLALINATGSQHDCNDVYFSVWNDNERAQEVLKERTTLLKLVDDWTSASREVDDLQVLVELGDEGGDESTLAEVRELLPALVQQVDRMEFARMLSGPHDPNNAIVSINAGAGGTEAQDWADMLLRMYLRWCERKGYKTEITEYQSGDEAGTKGVTFTVTGD